MEKLRELDTKQVVWLDPLPFDNTYVLLARPDFAIDNHINTISELARQLSNGGKAELCANAEWLEIHDGLRGIEKAYGFEWPREYVAKRPLAVRYQRAEGCDVLVGYATDPEVLSSGRRPLRDDREFFPEYLPALALREDVYRRIQTERPRAWAEVEMRLACLADHLDVETMRQLLMEMRSVSTDAEQLAESVLRERCPLRAEGGVTASEAAIQADRHDWNRTPLQKQRVPSGPTAASSR
jgi:osmoprotectant transport system substrate-binding protein